jgi:lactoylglutathione lyase
MQRMTSNNKARLGWVIIYVADPEDAVAFYERAFGLSRGLVAPGGSYAELETGSTTLAFASNELAESHFPGGFKRGDAHEPPFNSELALIFDDVPAAWQRALDAGCTALAKPEPKPQGQTVGYVRDPFGTLLEIASPLDGAG